MYVYIYRLVSNVNMNLNAPQWDPPWSIFDGEIDEINGPASRGPLIAVLQRMGCSDEPVGLGPVDDPWGIGILMIFDGSWKGCWMELDPLFHLMACSALQLSIHHPKKRYEQIWRVHLSVYIVTLLFWLCTNSLISLSNDEVFMHLSIHSWFKIM